MLLLLIAVAVIYFVMGQKTSDFMLAAIVVVSGISFYQDNRSRIAMALEKLNEPLSTVLRNGEP
jgi:Ca2+-transporting ATPase